MRRINPGFLLLLAAVSVMAQPDPPSRVGRLNYVSGSVSFQPSGVDEWTSAVVNRPLTTGDQIWVDSNSRAEIQIGSAVLRLGSRTAFQFLNLDDGATQIRLTEGTLSIDLRDLEANETFEVDTPNQAFSLLRPGQYRIDGDPDTQTTAITVFDGQGQVTGGGQSFDLGPGQQAAIHGDQQINYDLYPAPQLDDWDRWCRDRSLAEEHAQSANYVPRGMVGYEDLDNYGVWRESPYGAVWCPQGMPGDWAPYRNGHWAYVSPWGWTWIDDAPWGFAPFHYGRWVYWNNGWAWVPGPRGMRPVYAPAMVAWIGGPQWGVSLSLGGGVGWVPLGPREAFVPGYYHSPGYMNRVNISNTVNVTNVNVVNGGLDRRYMNAGAPNALNAMSQREMAAGRPARQFGRSFNASQLQGAQVIQNSPVAPDRGARLGPSGSGVVNRPPQSAYSRSVVVRNAPPQQQGGGTRPYVRQAPAVTNTGLAPRNAGGAVPVQQQQRGGWRSVSPQGNAAAPGGTSQGGWRSTRTDRPTRPAAQPAGQQQPVQQQLPQQRQQPLQQPQRPEQQRPQPQQRDARKEPRPEKRETKHETAAPKN